MRLLVVDDALDIATLLKLAFQMDGYAVDTALSGAHALELAAIHAYDVLLLHQAGFQTLAAYDGRTALDLAQRASPSLIILDRGLPDQDGLAVCRSIRQTSQVPIVMLTRRSSAEERAQGLAAGANTYLSKPFDADELQATVRALLSNPAPATA